MEEKSLEKSLSVKDILCKERLGTVSLIPYLKEDVYCFVFI